MIASFDKNKEIKSLGHWLSHQKQNYKNNKEINNIYISKKIYRNIEWLNDDGTLNFVLHQEPIYRRLIPEPMETVNHTFIISSIIDYLNQGDWQH